MILSSNIQDILPYRDWPNTQVEDGSTTYTYGPSGLNIPLQSGQYFKFKWAAIINNGVPKIAQIDIGDTINNLTTGYSIDNFSPNIDLKNITLGFDASGNYLFGAQYKDIVKLWYKSGSILNEYDWHGTYPTLFNSVQVTLPLLYPPPLYHKWNTGDVYCFYQKTNNINYRLLSDNFSIEYTGNTGLNFFSGSTQAVSFEQPEPNSNDPYRIVRVQPSFDGQRVKTFTSKSNTYYALLSFQEEEIGTLNEVGITGKISYDYGNWAKENLLGISSGYINNIRSYLVDNFESELIGSANPTFPITLYNPNITTGLIRNIFIPYTVLTFYDTFSGYVPQDNIYIFSAGNFFISGIDQKNIIGYSFNVSNRFYDTFEGYKTGLVKYLRRGIYNGSNQFYGRVFRLY